MVWTRIYKSLSRIYGFSPHDISLMTKAQVLAYVSDDEGGQEMDEENWLAYVDRIHTQYHGEDAVQ